MLSLGAVGRELYVNQARYSYLPNYVYQPTLEARVAPHDDAGQTYMPPVKKTKFAGQTFVQTTQPAIPSLPGVVATQQEAAAIAQAHNEMAMRLIASQRALQMLETQRT